MNNNLISECKSFVESSMEQNGGKQYTYHNIAHTDRVEQAARKLAAKANLDDNEKELLILAAIFHDVGFCFGAENHEETGAKIAEAKLLELKVDKERIIAVKELIEATKNGWEGTNRLALLLRDADMSGLASSDYYDISEGLRKEKAFLSSESIYQADWIDQNIQFFKEHKFATPEGKKLFRKKKKKNLKNLKKLKERNEQELTIASSKSAQTQLKTALRNHIDLSAIADNKANIMLSVNAIVITVGIPLLLQRCMTNPNLFIPTIIIGVSSIISMVFATLSTRPQKMTGITNKELIPQKQTNLFFFGNYYNMQFDDYEEGMKQVVADNDLMDNSITRDLFFLGKTLGVKFAQLRICYNIFMGGIIGAAISLIVVTLISRM